MRYFTISPKGRKGYNFKEMSYMYQLSIDLFGKYEDFYIYADNRKAAIEIGKIIVSAITFESTTKDIQSSVNHQNALQQLHVAYVMLEEGKEDTDKVIDYIKRIKEKYNLIDENETKETTQTIDKTSKGELQMKNKKVQVKIYNVAINGKSYHIELTHKNTTMNSITYSCRSFEVLSEKELLVPLKRFDIIYDRQSQSYGAWTGDVIRDDERALREEIANVITQIENNKYISNNSKQEETNEINNSKLTQAENILLSHNVDLSNVSKWTEEQIIEYASCINMNDSMGNIISTDKPEKTNTYIAFNRSFSSYNEAYTHCIESDLDTSYIQSETVKERPLTLDLQRFASSPANRKLYESNCDSVKIVTTSGEHIARIHPSDENEYQHKIFYSSDDSFSINDTDIISVTPIYRKSIITEHGVQKIGIGRHLEFAYTIETTKTDLEVDDINYSNIHSYKCNSIQETLERFNRFQKMGYHNINIQTNVNYKNDIIISDNSECNIEIEINTQYMNDLKKDNKQMKEQLEQLYNELNNYKEFMNLYKAEKTFEQFKENKNNNQVS